MSYRNVLEQALFLRWLIAWKDRPATKNNALTKEQIAHRGYALNTLLSFDEMQKDQPTIFFDEKP